MNLYKTHEYQIRTMRRFLVCLLMVPGSGSNQTSWKQHICLKKKLFSTIKAKSKPKFSNISWYKRFPAHNVMTITHRWNSTIPPDRSFMFPVSGSCFRFLFPGDRTWSGEPLTGAGRQRPRRTEASLGLRWLMEFPHGRFASSVSEVGNKPWK